MHYSYLDSGCCDLGAKGKGGKRQEREDGERRAENTSQSKFLAMASKNGCFVRTLTLASGRSENVKGACYGML